MPTEPPIDNGAAVGKGRPAPERVVGGQRRRGARPGTAKPVVLWEGVPRAWGARDRAAGEGAACSGLDWSGLARPRVARSGVARPRVARTRVPRLDGGLGGPPRDVGGRCREPLASEHAGLISVRWIWFAGPVGWSRGLHLEPTEPATIGQ
ncbi:MAG: hypothetical protein M3Z25_11900 [Actinomycetota bacterium]|nr:hypothetical protein [Actinomycetota bacterium]